MGKYQIQRVASIFCALCFVSSYAYAAAFKWTGRGDHRTWEDKQNWDPSAAVGRITVADNTTLELADRSQLTGTVRFDGPGMYRWTGGGVAGDLVVEAAAT
jgi:hypothetical protein